MAGIPNCPKCDSEYTYEDGNLIVCPMCGYEWSKEEEAEKNEERVVRDSNGTMWS